MFKIKAYIVSLLLALSSGAFAQDYYTPVKKELEPLARFPLTAFAMNDRALRYELPQDLTGRPIVVSMQRMYAGLDGMRLYSGPLGTASCMGTDVLPACVIQHRNLAIDPAARNQFLNQKHVDPETRVKAQGVADSFSSGNEPIGFISRRTLPTQQ